VVLWTDQAHWDPELRHHAEVRPLDPATFGPSAIADLRRDLGLPPDARDAIFVNIGNNWAFHAGLLSVARRMPSVVVLHDLAIQEMLLDSVTNGRLDRDVYLDATARTYGAEARATAHAALEGQPGARAAMLAHSGIDLAVDRALAVVTHSDAAHRAFVRPPAFEIAPLPLPFPSATDVSARRLRSGPLRLLQFGFIGSNRRLLEILDALGALRDRLDFRFDLAGEVWNEGLVAERIARLELQDRVVMHGFLPEPALDQLISQAHLVLNLRYPSMGEASGSQLRIWSRAACSVVSDIGWYAELPEGTVLRLPARPDTEAEHLAPLILEMDANRARSAEVGQAGLAHLRACHGPGDYAEALCRIADRTAELSRDFLMRACAARHPDPLSQGVEPPE
jgi:glycosyltransferase involved in cell wall biosynthesis